MKITVKCKLISDTKTKIDALNQMANQYNNVVNIYFKVLTKRHLGWSKKKLMALLEQRKDLLKWFPGFPSALR